MAAAWQPGGDGPAPARGTYHLTVRYRVLGPLELGDGSLGSLNQERLLAVLLACRGRTVAVDVLIDALWDDDPPRTAIATLRTYVSRLRRSVGDVLMSERGGYRLAVAPGDVDADRFEELRRIADEGTSHAALAALDAALELWRGDPFTGHTHVGPVLAESRRLVELRGAVDVRRLELLVGCGDAVTAVAEAEARLATAPEHEPTWVALVDALVRLGRPLDATRAAQRARRALASVGLSPGPLLSAAEARALEPTPDPPGATPVLEVRRRSRPRGRIALGPSSFLGRESDIATVLELTARERLVTLVGSGGVGKTRLAQEVIDRMAAGVEAWFVELGHLDAGADVAAALVSALGLRDPDIDRSLASAGALDGLLVLDNAEHVIDHVAAAVGRMIAGGSALRVLVTSRERLAVDGEHVHRVQPLERGGTDDPAQRLFVDRARAAGVTVEVERDREHLDRIVDLLDGLPLAIEMAAAQLPTCTVRELDERLTSGRAELSTDRRDVHDRHRTLAALIDWSVERLADDDAEVLRQLTVFAGSFTLDDVAAVLGRSAAPLVRRLAERSLLTTTRGAEHVRFAHFHVVREHLTAAGHPAPDPLRARHAHWCANVVRRADQRLRSADEPVGRAMLTTMLAEIRAGHQWASEHDRPLALALSAGLHRYAQSALHDEVLGWADRLVDRGIEPDDDRRDLATALASAASRAVNRGDSARGIDLARVALDLAPDDAASLPALEILADAAIYDGRLDEAHEAYRELHRRGLRAADDWYWPMGWSGLVLVAVYGGPSADEVGEGVEAPELDEVPPTARTFVEYARAERLVETDPGAALDRLRGLLGLVRSIPSPFSEGITLTSIAAVRGRTDEPARSLSDHRAAISHWVGLADRPHQATALRNLVPVLARLGEHEMACELLGLLDACGIPTYGSEAERLARATQQIRAALGPERSEELRARGSRRDLVDGARWAIDELDRLVVDGG